MIICIHYINYDYPIKAIISDGGVGTYDSGALPIALRGPAYQVEG